MERIILPYYQSSSKLLLLAPYIKINNSLLASKVMIIYSLQEEEI